MPKTRSISNGYGRDFGTCAAGLPPSELAALGLSAHWGMLRSMDRHACTDAHWHRLAPLLPPHEPRVCRPNQPQRRILDDILGTRPTSLPWRDVPMHYGSWHSVPSRCYRWRKPVSSYGSCGPCSVKRTVTGSGIGRSTFSTPSLCAHSHAAGPKANTTERPQGRRSVLGHQLQSTTFRGLPGPRRPGARRYIAHGPPAWRGSRAKAGSRSYALLPSVGHQLAGASVELDVRRRTCRRGVGLPAHPCCGCGRRWCTLQFTNTLA